MNLPPTSNINAVMLDQAPGAPDAYQAQQSMQQLGSNMNVQQETASTGAINQIVNAARQGAMQQTTPELKAQAFKDYATAELQRQANVGQAKIALAQSGNRDEVLRRIYGG